MRRSRTIYFNDARHYYLFVFEPPMRMQDAWIPIDEVAGTAVDTFIYGVSRGDGLFYPSEVGRRFGTDLDKHSMAAYWRVWENMQSLIERDLDPLRVLIDRAHEKGMEFFASLRMGDFPGLDPSFTTAEDGRGYVHQETRDHQFAVLKELATRYPVEGIELDFAAAPGGTSFWFRPEDVAEHTPLMTDYVRQISQMVRQRPGSPGQIGARVYPTEELNNNTGLDVRAWLESGLVDYVVPMLYSSFTLDGHMPFDWLIDAAHANDISVYPMLQPYYTDESRRFHTVTHATPAMMRAAAANNWARGADGTYTWFMPWPLGTTERSVLSEFGHPDGGIEKDKHYFLRRARESAENHDYHASLPQTLSQDDAGKRFQIPFFISDDLQNTQVHQITMRLGIEDLLTADKLDIRLNGHSLAGETCTRESLRTNDPYGGQWLSFDLCSVRPQQGDNVLDIALIERPANIGSDLVVEDIEVIVHYGTFPTYCDKN